MDSALPLRHVEMRWDGVEDRDAFPYALPAVRNPAR
jgi:hypothetical protein